MVAISSLILIAWASKGAYGLNNFLPSPSVFGAGFGFFLC